jgi:hypothetical protein
MKRSESGHEEIRKGPCRDKEGNMRRLTRGHEEIRKGT